MAIKITVDNEIYEVDETLSVIAACDRIGIEIPRFCYHNNLSISGNCRMCLVEVEGMPKLAPACATGLREGMVIHTQTPKVQEAQAGVMALLLINHPLDCPICDQAGECDLQDVSYAYGFQNGQFEDVKRVVARKDLGPVLEDHLTRCILCSRCIRFCDEVMGESALGFVNRGDRTEVEPMTAGGVLHELSGNLVDICPVGALTSKRSAHTARPWEMIKIPTIDYFDGLGSHVRLDCLDNRVIRVLPRLCEPINECWIGDKSRYSLDALSFQRLSQPYRRDEEGKLAPISFQEALKEVAGRLKGAAAERIGVLASPMMDMESLWAAKELFGRLGVAVEGRLSGLGLPTETAGRGSWRFNATIKGIDQADYVLLIGVDLRKEAPLLAARLRKNVLRRAEGFGVGVVGTAAPSVPFDDFGDSFHKAAAHLKSGLAQRLGAAKKPLVIIGQGVLDRATAPQTFGFVEKLRALGALEADGYNGLSVLQTAPNGLGVLEIGAVANGREDVMQKARKGELDVLYIIGEGDAVLPAVFEKPYVIYQGSHGDRAAEKADMVLPATTYGEKSGWYMNTEGRLQQAHQAVNPLGEAMDDWYIFVRLAIALYQPLGYESAEQIMAAVHKRYGDFTTFPLAAPLAWPKNPYPETPWGEDPLKSPFASYYQTDTLSRQSPSMAHLRAAVASREGTS